MDAIPSVAEQRAAVQNMGADRMSDLQNKVEDGDNDRAFKALITAGKRFIFGPCGKWLKVQHICGNGGGSVPTITIKVVELACDHIKARCKSAKLSERDTDMQSKIKKACVAGFTLHCQAEAVER